MTETYKFRITAGFLIRGAIRRNLREGTFECGVDLSIEEERGWLESLFLCTATGTHENLRIFKMALLNWAEANEKTIR